MRQMTQLCALEFGGHYSRAQQPYVCTCTGELTRVLRISLFIFNALPDVGWRIEPVLLQLDWVSWFDIGAMKSPIYNILRFSLDIAGASCMSASNSKALCFIEGQDACIVTSSYHNLGYDVLIHYSTALPMCKCIGWFFQCCCSCLHKKTMDDDWKNFWQAIVSEDKHGKGSGAHWKIQTSSFYLLYLCNVNECWGKSNVEVINYFVTAICCLSQFDFPVK